MSSKFKRYTSPFGRKQAKKFLSKDIPEKNSNTKQNTSNSDLLIKGASSLSVMSKVLTSAAEKARGSIQDLIDITNESIDENDNRKSKGKIATETDFLAYQESFARDITSQLNSDNNDINSLYKNAANDIIKRRRPIESKPKLSSPVNGAIPEIDYITVNENGKGSVDKFSANVVFTLPYNEIKDFKVRAVRIFRSKKSVPETLRKTRTRLSRYGVDELKSDDTRTRNRNSAKDVLFQQMYFSKNGVASALDDMVITDRITGERVAVTGGSGSYKTSGDQFSTDANNLALLSSFINVNDVSGVDASVAENLKAIRNIQLQNPELVSKGNVINTFGRGTIDRDVIDNLLPAQIESMRNSIGIDSGIVSEVSSPYKEIAIIPIARLKSRNIGSNDNALVEFFFEDKTVEFGATYTYYITSLDDHMVESVRSKIVKVNVEKIIPPSEPDILTAKEFDHYTVLSMRAKQGESVEKFEVYRKNLTQQKKFESEIQVIDGKDGFIVGKEKRTEIGNGFDQIGEIINLKFGGAVFRDMTAVAGNKYEYRVYSVDIYGNKSQKPKSVSIFLKKNTNKIVDLRKPTAIAEVDQFTKKIKITIENDDDRAVAFFLSRKNLTINERAFTIPSQPAQINFGKKDTLSKTEEGIVLRLSSWQGYFPNQGNKIEFLDTTSRIDNTYQYCLYSVDRFGNKSPCEITPPLFISRRPIVSKPLNLTAIKSKDDIRISWDDGNIDVDPLDRIGDRDVFEANSVNTLFQVERKKVGSERWEKFPLTEEKFIDDKIASNFEAPQYRPKFLEVDSEYVYRVAALQTGGFISNFSDNIKVSTFSKVLPPINFKIKHSDIRNNPFFIALNWDTSSDSGTIDRWKIERAVVNNFAAAKLNISNTDDIRALKFETITHVHKEASRSRARIYDVLDKTDSMGGRLRTVVKSMKRRDTLSGKHHFIDKDVSVGNTYFYRITAIGLNNNNVSSPLIRGLRVTDSIGDRKINRTLTQKERNKLSRLTTPLTTKVKLRKDGK